MNSSKHRNAVCNTCTLKLVDIAYRRAPWFRLIREPLKLGMRLLIVFHQVKPDEYILRTPACNNCFRFYKLALKENSSVFRWFNARINPVFDIALEKIVSKNELEDAKAYARRATHGDLTPDEARTWMAGLKTGF
jgi:hypothetical protein